MTNGRVFYTRIIPVVGEALVSSIYYHPSPNRSFNRPETFSNGQVIVTFRNRGGSIMAIEDGELTYFSTVEVVTTEDFSFQSRTINLKDTGVEAYTVTLRGPAPRLKDLETLDSVLTIPLAGAFVAAEARRYGPRDGGAPLRVEWPEVSRFDSPGLPPDTFGFDHTG